MSTIETDNWDTFTSEVADAVAADSEVEIVTGHETNGNFVALVDGGAPA